MDYHEGTHPNVHLTYLELMHWIAVSDFEFISSRVDDDMFEFTIYGDESVIEKRDSVGLALVLLPDAKHPDGYVTVDCQYDELQADLIMAGMDSSFVI